MKVALVHDHLMQKGGAERVLEVLQSLWPEAPTFTLLYDKARMADRPRLQLSWWARLTRWLHPEKAGRLESWDA